MADISPDKSKNLKKSAQYFTKLYTELNLDKYKLQKDKKLFELISFQNMHDADLAYHDVYVKCAASAWSKQSLLRCLEQELTLAIKNPAAFNADIYKQHFTIAVIEVIRQLQKGLVDHLF